MNGKVNLLEVDLKEIEPVTEFFIAYRIGKETNTDVLEYCGVMPLYEDFKDLKLLSTDEVSEIIEIYETKKKLIEDKTLVTETECYMYKRILEDIEELEGYRY